MRNRFQLACFSAAFLSTTAGAAWFETGGTVESRPGVKQPYVLSIAVNADKSNIERHEVKNIVLLLTGGAGIISPASESIKQQRPERLALRGFFAEKLGALVAVGAPGDHAGGISTDWREGKSHITDVRAVMDVVMKQFPVARVTVLGFSNGCRSATNISASERVHWGARLQGVALLSCAPAAFAEARMSALSTVPVLVVHHRDDSCLPYDDIKNIARQYEFVTIDGPPRPAAATRDCGSNSAHEFGGSEVKAYQAVTDWVLSRVVIHHPR